MWKEQDDEGNKLGAEGEMEEALRNRVRCGWFWKIVNTMSLHLFWLGGVHL